MKGLHLTRFLFGGLIVVLFLGCSRTEVTGLAGVDFARIGDESISAEDAKNMVEVLERIRQIREKKSPRPFGKWANRKAALITPQLAYSIALNQRMMNEGIEPTRESDATVLSRYSRQLKKPLKSEADLLALLGDLGDFFHSQFVRESRFEAYLTANRGKFEVSDREIDRYYRGLTNQVKRCEKINAQAMVKINQAWEELKRGVAWDLVATNYTEDALLEPSYAENWKDWIELQLKDVHNEKLAAALQKMSPGEFTEPIETEEGMIIVRLVQKSDETYSLARILVRMAIQVNFPKRKTAIQKLKREKVEEFTRCAFSNAAESVKVEFPLGREFSYEIWPEPKSGENAFRLER